MRDRLHHDQELGRQLQRQLRLLAGRQFQRVECQLLGDRFQIVRQVHPRSPEDLPEVFEKGQFVRLMAGDPANAPGDRERDLDDFVERRFIAGSAPRADILLGMHAFQRRVGFEHAAAAGAQHVPRQLEDAEPRRVQKRGDYPLLVEVILRGESDRVYAAQRAIRRLGDKMLDCGNGFAVGGLAQRREQRIRFARQGYGHERRSGQ